MQLRPLSDQVVVLFGASSGIGRITAIQAAERGARVMVAARGQEGLDSLVTEIQQAGGTAASMPADTTDYEQVRAVAEATVEQFGRIDTWVHLAGVSVYAPFDETTPDEFRQIIDVNLLGQAYGAMAALPYLKQAGGGALIHVSSVEGERALPLHSAYAASKHGIEGMLEALRVELRHEGWPISVTSIKPASINTPFFESARTKIGVEPKGMPPVYEPEAVARAILYAAEHPVPELVVGGAGKALIMGQRLVPGLVDALMLRFGYVLQRSDRPKADSAPDNLYVPAGSETVHGRQPAKPASMYTWLATHRAPRLALAGVAAAGITALALRARR